MNTPFLTRLVLVSVSLVVVFAIVFTWGDAAGVWPEAPAPVFAHTDLVAGFLLAVFLAARTVRSRRRAAEREDRELG